MRKYFIAGNWKMHKTIPEATALAEALRTALAGIADAENRRFMVAPPFTALAAVAKVLDGSNIAVGAQNMAAELSGAHTGEIAAGMLKDAGARVVILGHSERRHVYGESNELINRKVRLALSEGLEVILCVGETLDEREAGKAESVVETQLSAGLAEVTDLAEVVIAYEPVWAIGTGKTATPEDAAAIHGRIRTWVSSRYGTGAADKLIIQYGGSVKPDNAAQLMAKEDIDGALVGGASLAADSFAAIAGFRRS